VVDGEATHAESVRVAKSMRRPGAPDVRSGELVVAALDARSFAEIEAAACAAMPGAACSVAAALSDHGPYLVRVEHLVGRRDARAKSATRALAKSATTVGSFEWIEPNGVVAAFDEPNDPLYAEQFALREMRVPYVWSMTQGDPSIVVAVLDSGTMPHPDLDGQYVAGYDFVSDPASSMDGDGWDADPSDAAYVLHGTHVAGIIGAKANNQIGVAGVAWNTRILPVRVLGGQGGTWFDVAAGLRWAVGLPVSGAPANPTPARVVNMSIGTYYDSEVQRGTVAEIVSTRPEVVLVAAAGNESTNYPLYPAAYPGVIAVYALDRNFHWTTYSNYGTWISVGAFGGDWWRGEPGILSTFWDMATNQPDYEELCGTSMASPQVAGVAALLLALKPTMTGAEVKDALQRTAWDLGAPGFDTDYGWGAVNALAAATFVTSPFALPEAIDVAPAALAFEGAALAADVFVRTKSATPVTISQVDATMDEVGAAGRLTASLDQSVTPATATVRIDPSLADGVYSGKIRLTTSVGIVDVPVRVVRSPRSNLNNVLVSAVDPVGRVVATTTTSAAKNWAWSLSEVPLGQYRIVALGDQNGSLKFDRVDEWEGAWPLVTQPQNVDVTTDSLDSAGIDIPISRYDARVSYAGVGQGGIAGAVAVRVTDAADRAIAAAAVHVGGGAPLTTTDARGRGVVVGSMMGGQVVTAVADGFLPITRIGEDAQYQSFTLPSSDAPATTVVVATVRGLAASDRDVYVQVGDARGHVVYAGGADPAFTLTVTNSAGTVPVSAVAFDSTGVPTRHALYEMAAPVPAFDVQLTALASGGAQSRTVQPSAPTSNFTTAGATASSAAYVRWSGTSWVDVGESPLTFGQNKTGWWAAPDAPATPLAMKFEVVATDAAGRWSRRIVYGDTSGPPAAAGAFALDTPTRPIVPADGATGVSTAPILAWDDVPGAQLERLVVEQPGTPWRWTFWIAGSLYHVDLPSLLKGGLAPATNYRWSVETFRFASGFDASNYRDDRVETTSTSRTFSGWSMFRTQ
jgi:serine protease